MEEVDAIVSVGLSREPPLTSWSPVTVEGDLLSLLEMA